MRKNVHVLIAFFVIFIMLGSALSLTAMEKKTDIYDGSLDVKSAIESSLVKAKKENKNVLLMFGGNWCPWCHKLHHLFGSDAAVKQFLADNFLLIMVDVGTRPKPLNADLVSKYRVQKMGYPSLAVLGQNGELLVSQSTGILEKGKAHDPKRVMGFLKANAPAKK